MSEREKWTVGALLALALALRLYHVDAPLTDLHSWNQASAAAVIRHVVRDPRSLLRPEWDVWDHGRSGPKIGAEEAPIYHALVAIPAALGAPIPITGRVISSLIGIAGAVALWRLCRRRYGEVAAQAALVVYLFTPLSAYFGRAVASDVLAVAALAFALDAADCGRSPRPGSAWLWLTLSALAKPYMLAFWPAVWRWRHREGDDRARRLRTAAWSFVPVLATFVWLGWAQSIGNLGNVTRESSAPWDNALFGPIALAVEPRFWGVLATRIARELLTPVPAVLAVVGLSVALRRARNGLGECLLAMGCLVQALVVRQGFFIHNYYQYQWIVPAAILVAVAVNALVKRKGFPPEARRLVVGALAVAVLAFALPVLRGFHRYDRSDPAAAALVDAHCPAGEPIIVWEPDPDRKPQLFFLADRSGWFFRSPRPGDLERHRNLGARCLVVNMPQRSPLWNGPVYASLESGHEGAAETMSAGRFGEERLVKVYGLNSPVTPTAGE